MVLYFAIVAVWGAITFFLNRDGSSAFWGSVSIATYVAVAQAILGAMLYGAGAAPRDLTHALYGATSILAFPAARLYTANRSPRAQLITTTLVAFFLVGVSIRGITTGR